MTVTKTKPSESPPRYREIKERMQPVSRPRLSEEGVNRQVDGRGKCEQKRKNSFLQNGIKYLPVILERSDGK